MRHCLWCGRKFEPRARSHDHCCSRDCERLWDCRDGSPDPADFMPQTGQLDLRLFEEAAEEIRKEKEADANAE